jgi:hypothetical protein
MKNYIFYGKIFDDVQIEAYKEYFETIEDDEWVREDDETAVRYRFTLYKNYPNPEALIDKYLDKMPDEVRGCFEKGMLEQQGYSIDAKLAKYLPGDNFDWHCDDWVYDPKLPTARRVLTSITYLNDDFDGGQTEFFDGDIITPEAGKTLVFPSFWLFPHRGREVVCGVKKILVMHVWI